MNPSKNLATLLSTNFTTVGVRFDRAHGKTSDTEYTYKIPRDWYDKIAVNDRVIVESPKDGYVAVTITRLDAEPSDDIFDPLRERIKWKWVVTLIDDSNYKEQLANEGKLLKYYKLAMRNKQRRELEEQLLNLFDGEEAAELKNLLSKI
jgi:hypothetical protein